MYEIYKIILTVPSQKSHYWNCVSIQR